MTGFTSPTTQVARKNHRCSPCGRIISPGETYTRQRGYEGGDAWTYKDCAHCRAVIRIWDPRDDSDLISEDAFAYWADDPGETISETRAKAGWRHNWRTQSGKLWPLPAYDEATR